ncbi:premnaspirodiene oxygenase-like [Lycium barbarum]|uniref:premnaspirodiene oxygenase-like n=1 Tax=Lycium barbarum TaxID=112863 RepID=UPI00293E13F2|nr:premnaspirodiene oxygenase-like [Lycium barbarum]
METQHLLFIFISLSLFLSFIFHLVHIWKKSKTLSKRLPPGPWRLPFIGNLHQLMNGRLIHHTFRNLSQRYGPIFHLRLGETSVIVVSSLDMAKEIMKTQDLHFATRPQLMAGEIIMYNHSDIGTCPYGDYWRNMRKVCILELLSAKMVKSFNSIRQAEMSSLISSINSMPNSLINLSDKIFWFTSVVTCRSALGKLIHNQDTLIMLIKDVALLAAGFDLADLFPSRKWLHGISGLKSKILKVHKEADVILENIINEHLENLANGKKGNIESGGEDLIDVLLRVMESDELGTSITHNNIKAVIFDMFIAGAETSSATIIWALAEMIRNPSIMVKAQREVREILKGKKTFEDTDLEELKYLELVIKETLRLHPPLPLLLPRECRKETKIGNYTIPIKTRVLVNAWAIGRDPEYWQYPESFIPERFENNSIDFKGNHFEFIPFGAGRRMCPGLLFGLVNVGHPLAQLLYHFDWKTPYEVTPDNFDMAETDGVTARRKEDLCLIATPFGLS